MSTTAVLALDIPLHPLPLPSTATGNAITSSSLPSSETDNGSPYSPTHTPKPILKKPNSQRASARHKKVTFQRPEDTHKFMKSDYVTYKLNKPPKTKIRIHRELKAARTGQKKRRMFLPASFDRSRLNFAKKPAFKRQPLIHPDEDEETQKSTSGSSSFIVPGKLTATRHTEGSSVSSQVGESVCVVTNVDIQEILFDELWDQESTMKLHPPGIPSSVNTIKNHQEWEQDCCLEPRNLVCEMESSKNACGEHIEMTLCTSIQRDRSLFTSGTVIESEVTQDGEKCGEITPSSSPTRDQDIEMSGAAIQPLTTHDGENYEVMIRNSSFKQDQDAELYGTEVETIHDGEHMRVGEKPPCFSCEGDLDIEMTGTVVEISIIQEDTLGESIRFISESQINEDGTCLKETLDENTRKASHHLSEQSLTEDPRGDDLSTEGQCNEKSQESYDMSYFETRDFVSSSTTHLPAGTIVSILASTPDPDPYWLFELSTDVPLRDIRATKEKLLRGFYLSDSTGTGVFERDPDMFPDFITVVNILKDTSNRLMLPLIQERSENQVIITEATRRALIQLSVATKSRVKTRRSRRRKSSGGY